MKENKNDIMNEFYKVFNIEPEISYILEIQCEDAKCTMTVNKKGLSSILDTYKEKCKIIKEFDSTFSDELLLKMICVLNKFTGYTSLLNDDYAEIKDEILRDVLFAHENLKLHKADLTKQIRQLFKEA